MTDYGSYDGDSVHDMWVDTTYEAHTGNNAYGGNGGYSARGYSGGASAARVRSRISNYQPPYSLRKREYQWTVRQMQLKIECQQSLIAKDEAAMAAARERLAAHNLSEYHRKDLADKIKGYANSIRLRQEDVKRYSRRIVDAKIAYDRWRRDTAVAVWATVAIVIITTLIAIIAG